MSQQRRKEEECSVDSGASEFVRLSFAAADLALCCSSWQVENFFFFYMRVAEYRVGVAQRRPIIHRSSTFSICVFLTLSDRDGS